MWLDKTIHKPTDMKKLLLCALLALAACTASAYNFMEFKYADGKVKTLSTVGLTITVDGTNLLISNLAGESLNVASDNLVSMQFTDDNSAKVATIIDLNSSVDAYNLEGVHFGKFDSAKDAHASLQPGVYVLKNSEGGTIKIVINK